VGFGRLGAGTGATWTRIRAAAAAAAATTAIAIAYEAFRQGFALSTVPPLLLFYGGSAVIIIAFSVWTTAEIGLPSFLLLSQLPVRERLWRWLVLGVGLGFLLAGASAALSGGAETPLQPWFWRRIQTPLGAVLFSARSALLEETFFRLFLIPFLVSVALRARPGHHRLKLANGSALAMHEGRQAGRLVIVVACVVSSAMFGLAHPFNPIGAALLAPLLAVAYLWGGWESSVTAHFVANVVLFSFYY